LRDVRIFPEKNNRKEQMIGCLYAFSLMFLIISGCGIRTTPELISGDANTVSFLAGANPNWAMNDIKMMMHEHLALTTDEAVARIKKDYSGDISAYDKVHDEILKMADMLSSGIVVQFPDKFK